MIGLKYAHRAFDWDDGYDDEGYCGGFGYSPPKPPRCRRCGIGGALWWVNGSNGWRLHDHNGAHVCPPPPATQEFTAAVLPE